MVIPLPFWLAGLFLMGFGAFFWLLIVIFLLELVNERLRGKNVISVWDPKSEEFVDRANTLRQGLVGYLALFLIGLFFFLFGYWAYTF